MLDSHPPLSPGRLVGLVLAAILILLDVGFIVLLISLPVGIFTVLLCLLLLVSLPLIGAVIFVTVGISGARYQVEGDVLLIRWGRMVQRVPMAAIAELLPSDAIKDIRDFRGIRWPGCMIGQGLADLRDGRQLRISSFATRTADEQVLVVTDEMTYGISPTDPTNFIVSLQALLETEIGDDQTGTHENMNVQGWSIWPERDALIIIGVSVLLNLALFVILAIINSRLPEKSALHFNKFGEVDRTGSAAELFILPLIGAIAWVSAVIGGWFFYYIRHEKPVAYLILGFTVLIQIATWIAMLGLVTH
ncbi:MAG: PH domain-containing protein [Candidatus Promineifilaceae bacterium]